MSIQTLSKSDLYNYLVKLSDQYYLSNDSTITDEKFDSYVLFYELKFNDKFTYIGKSINARVELPCYMGSLNKCKEDHSLNLFTNRVIQTLENNEFIITDKIDGLSLLIDFTNKKIYTRGDGKIGSDVSFLFKYIKGIPKNDLNITVRGEIVILKKDYDILTKYNFNNPRNAVAGILNSKEICVELYKSLTFIAYYIVDYPYNNDRMFEELSKNFITPNYEKVTVSSINSTTLTYIYETRLKNRKYEMDGLVVSSVVNYKEKEGDNPKFTIAFKTTGKLYETVVEEVEWNLTKGQLLKPRVKITPVIIDGVKIQYCSGFNAKFILSNSIGPGTVVNITRSGDVIPHIVNIVKSTYAQLPEEYEWDWVGEMVDIACTQETENILNELFVKRIECMSNTLEIRGFKSGVIKKLLQVGINNEEKLFKLNKDNIVKVKGIGEKQWELILNAVTRIKENIDLVECMYSSCIFTNFGILRLKDAVWTHPDSCSMIQEYILQDKEIDFDRLEDVLKNIGFPTMASTFIIYLKKFKKYFNLYFRSDDFKRLKKKSNTTTVKVETNGVLKDKSIVLTGFRDKELKEIIEKHGGKVTDSVTQKTFAVIAKDKNEESTKLSKAVSLNIKIYDKEEFLNILN